MNVDKLRKKLINNIIAFAVITAIVGCIGIALTIYMLTDNTTNNGFNTVYHSH